MNRDAQALGRRRFGHLRFDSNSRRMVLDGWELHCGDCFEVNVDGVWTQTRIEHGVDWYLVGIPGREIEGLEARSHE